MSHFCQVCGHDRLAAFPEFSALPRITSDSRPFRPGGELEVCESCGAIQKFPSPAWFEEIGEIYRNYYAYYQAEGAEQIVFDARTNSVRFRSDVLLERLVETKTMQETGAALDIGCGTGVTLASISRALPKYRLFGQDLDRRNEKRLLGIPRFEALYTHPPVEVPGVFEIVTLIHSLEHFPQPLNLLGAVRNKLAAQGLLLIQVCDADRNPFDLLIADHLMHFTGLSLRRIVENAGLAVRVLANDWIGKELTCVADRGREESKQQDSGVDVGRVRRQISANLRWLRELIDTAHRLSKTQVPLGIFGTSIAATWLAGNLDGGFQFFVDEDPNRIGRVHMGKPVVSPKDVEPGRVVFLALTPAVAQAISTRLQHLPIRFVQPPVIGPV